MNHTFYRIGRIGKTHGVKGEVQMQVDDDVFDRVDSDYVMLMIDGILVPFFMEEYRFKSDETALVKFCDIDTQQRARELTNCEVYFPRELAEEEEHDVTYAELCGYTLINAADNRSVGIIDYVDDSTDNILFSLTDDTLIPAAEELIIDVDYQQRTITVNIPEGLI